MTHGLSRITLQLASSLGHRFHVFSNQGKAQVSLSLDQNHGGPFAEKDKKQQKTAATKTGRNPNAPSPPFLSTKHMRILRGTATAGRKPKGTEEPFDVLCRHQVEPGYELVALNGTEMHSLAEGAFKPPRRLAGAVRTVFFFWYQRGPMDRMFFLFSFGVLPHVLFFFFLFISFGDFGCFDLAHEKRWWSWPIIFLSRDLRLILKILWARCIDRPAWCVCVCFSILSFVWQCFDYSGPCG